MNPMRIALAAALVAAGVLVAGDVPAAPSGRPSGAGTSAGPRSPGAAPGHGGQYRPAHPGGGYRHGGSYRHGGHSYGHYGSSYWGWSLGLGIGVPLALGWYDPYWWGPGYSYPSYAYGPALGGYGYACSPYDDCGRESLARSEPTPPSTEIGPVPSAGEGGPTQRPLHLNYCDSARAWFPHVRTCPGGWRLVLPEYSRAAP